MKVYFLDQDGNVYNEYGQVVGKVGVNGIVVDEENYLLYNGNKVGVVGGSLNDLNKANDLDRNKGNVRTLKKDNSAGFGQIMIVSLVLIALVLMIGVILVSLFG